MPLRALVSPMSVSLQFLERASAETGFQQVALEKVVRLGELAAEIGRHPFLGDLLALKGGTALNLAFGPPSRMSVDLDFNYVGQIDREKMLADRPRVETILADLARRTGYVVQHSAEAHAGRKLFLTYQSALGPKDRIEVDLNFLFRQPLGEPQRRPLWQPGDLDRPTVTVVSLDELLIGKCLALLDRAAPRDAWDVVNLTTDVRETLATRAFRHRFMAMAAVLTHPLAEYSADRLRRIVTDQAVQGQLRLMLIAGKTPSADSLCSAAWKIVEPLLVLTSTEQEYFAEVGRGQLRLDLLFESNPAEASRLAVHPALLWKIANVTRHLATRSWKST
jgi:predicted nucleotidyltransferase component of viral defense system